MYGLALTLASSVGVCYKVHVKEQIYPENFNEFIFRQYSFIDLNYGFQLHFEVECCAGYKYIFHSGCMS